MLLCSWLRSQPGERASERETQKERARERERGAAIAFQGQHIPQEPLLQKHTRAEKGGHCEQRGETGTRGQPARSWRGG